MLLGCGAVGDASWAGPASVQARTRATKKVRMGTSRETIVAGSSILSQNARSFRSGSVVNVLPTERTYNSAFEGANVHEESLCRMRPCCPACDERYRAGAPAWKRRKVRRGALCHVVQC